MKNERSYDIRRFKVLSYVNDTVSSTFFYVQILVKNTVGSKFISKPLLSLFMISTSHKTEDKRLHNPCWNKGKLHDYLER